MRIAMVVPTLGFSGGVERHARDLAIALSERGHRMTLLHRGRAGRDVAEYRRPFEHVALLDEAEGGRGLDVAYVHKVASVEELAALGDLPLAVAAHDHDLTCVRSHRYLPLSREPCGRPPGPGCVVHGCILVRDRSPTSRLGLRLRDPFALRRRLARLATRAPLVACSRFIGEHLVIAGAPRSRVEVAHPVPPESPRPIAPLPDEPRLLVVGQLVRGKGVDLAIEALAHLPRELALDVAGDGPSRPELERLAASHVPERVRFHGYLAPAAIDALYDSASLVVVPSRWPEPFGMVGIEAMRRARPVVGAAHGGIPEWLEEGAGGRLFRPGDARDLARAIALLLPDRRAGERAREWVLGRFPHAAAVDAVERLLGRLSDGEGQP